MNRIDRIRKMVMAALPLFIAAAAYGRGDAPGALPGMDSLEVRRGVAAGPRNEIDLKTNLVYDATMSINLGVEVGLGRRWSLDVSGNYNPWTLSGGRKWKHWMVQPGVRLWTKERQEGHFVGLPGIGGVYNLNKVRLPFDAYPTMGDYRFEGWGVGAGLSYGYRWNFSQRWAMEGEIGVGYIYAHYDKYRCTNCGERLASGTHHYVGPTKVALNLIYRFGKKKREGALRVQRTFVPAPVSNEPGERIVRDTVVVRDTVYLHDTVRVAPEAAMRHEKFTLRLHYKAGSSVLLRDFDGNPDQLAAFAGFIDRMRRDTSIVIQAVHIRGYCSVEGTADFNNRLSYARAQGVASFFRYRYPALAELLRIEGRGEDWEGLLTLVEEAYGLESQDEIVHTILNVGVYEGREKMLMMLSGGRSYRWMERELFPELRRIECQVDYTVKTLKK